MVKFGWIKWPETSCQYYRANVQGLDGLFLIIIHCVSRTHLFTIAAFTFGEINTLFIVDTVFQGNRLGIFDIDRFALYQARVLSVRYFFRAFLRTSITGDTFGFINISGVTNKLYLKVTRISTNFLDLTEGF